MINDDPQRRPGALAALCLDKEAEASQRAEAASPGMDTAWAGSREIRGGGHGNDARMPGAVSHFLAVSTSETRKATGFRVGQASYVMV